MKKMWKWWWVWQDREHEEWLAAQSRRGLHLRSVDRLFGLLHRFEEGAPAEHVYRWDFKIRGGKSDYRQLFEDAGWQLVGEVAGSWLCWRKPAEPGLQPEIFTDRASQKAKYRKLLLTILPGMSLAPLLFSDQALWRDLLAGGQQAAAVLALSVFSLALISFASFGLWRRLREI